MMAVPQTPGVGTAALPGQTLLDIQNLVVGYGALDILHGVNLQVAKGEIVSIIGPNGAGKSTLVKTVLGLLRPRQGSIMFNGEDLAGMKPSEIIKRGLCYVPQVRNVFPNLTVQENLEVGSYLLGRGADAAIAEVYDLFPVLKEKARQKAGSMSGGQRQMLAMGRALLLKPSLLVLDEPSAGLAPQMVDVIFGNIKDINKLGCTILMIEQNARRALAMSDRGYVLDMGRNAIDDTGAKLLQDPRVIELYLGKLASGQDANRASAAENADQGDA